ncbi:MAG TPA: hypothetical protein VFY43_05285 [Candidatus Limnocylindria bacterium]|nr:hypothetical protein [Candidatus Limnocylindria bacterium]
MLAKVQVSQSTAGRTEYLLQAPGGLTVFVDGVEPRGVQAVVSQLNARLASRTSEPSLKVSLAADGSTNRVDWESLSTPIWSIRAPATGAKRIQHLSALVRLRHLTLGRAPLHGAAAQRGDDAFIILGPAGSGKTRILIAMLEAGWMLAAGEWLVVDSGRFESADDRVDLRLKHLDELRQLRPRLGAGLTARRWISRVPGLGRFDRFELTAETLGAGRWAPGTVSQISKIIWSQATSEEARRPVRKLDDVLDLLVTSEMSRYASLIDALHRERKGLPLPSVIEQLPSLLRDRIRANLAGVPVQAVEHLPGEPLSEVARRAGVKA